MINQLLVDPVITAPRAMSFDEAMKKKNQNWKGNLKAKESQVDMLRQVFLHS